MDRFTPEAAPYYPAPSSCRFLEPILSPRPSPFASLPAQFLIAHRGVPAGAPESGATGLALARDAGAPAVEIDVRPTRDGLLVLLHDPSPRRLTGERAAAAERTARELLEAPLAAEPAEHLLLLDEALALLAGRTLLDIEVKPDAGANPEDLAARVAAVLGFSEDELPASHRAARVERDDNLFRVLVGALPDRASALSLALQLERLLGRPAVPFSR